MLAGMDMWLLLIDQSIHFELVLRAWLERDKKRGGSSSRRNEDLSALERVEAVYTYNICE